MKVIISFVFCVYFMLAGVLAFAACPDPQLVCQIYHPGSTMTGYCAYADCFDMSYGEEVRLVAGDDEGLFPRRWKMWNKHAADITQWGDFPCNIEPNGSKTKIWIPEGDTKCSVKLNSSNSSIFYEHFAANPLSGCLGWVECRE
ncbi:hypothetical protein [Citrifermentans bremense]|uniref:Uncharacterized protein n=1 Tax=Citrifermentans bremense TaxID=60035 RepID=A0A6S6LZV1_9BACT|nr:hypothetical protein [Citrifermentans bremense]